MPDTTLGITYPAQNASNDISYHMQVLAEDVNALLADGWVQVPLATGWTYDWFPTPMLARKIGNRVEFTSGFFSRTTNLATNPGVGYTVATLPVDMRPATTRIAGAGTFGAAGNIGGASVVFGADGAVQVISLIPAGTMSTTRGWGNHAGVGGGFILVN